MKLDGAAAIVTGAASGLGAATAAHLAAAGAAVTVADLDEEGGRAVADRIGGRFARASVSDEEALAAAVEAAAADRPLRLAVACAGRGAGGRILTRDGTPHSLSSFTRSLEVYLVGTFNLLRLAAARMATNEPDDDGERGAIVATASVAAFEGQIGQAAYAAAKGGVVGMTLPAARDLGSRGIRVVTIAPGLIRTPAYGELTDEQADHLARETPFPPRMGRADEFAALVEHVATNAMLNGCVLRLDGGIRLGPRF